MSDTQISTPRSGVHGPSLTNPLAGAAEPAALTINCFGLLTVTAISAAGTGLSSLLASLPTIIVDNRYRVMGINSKAAVFWICEVVGVVVRIPEAVVGVLCRLHLLTQEEEGG